MNVSESDLNINTNGTSSLKESMQKKMLSMPPPLWPQLDHRTAQSITDGFLLGVDKGISSKNTIGKFLS